jgi:hypothetical protein
MDSGYAAVMIINRFMAVPIAVLRMETPNDLTKPLLAKAILYDSRLNPLGQNFTRLAVVDAESLKEIASKFTMGSAQERASKASRQ